MVLLAILGSLSCSGDGGDDVSADADRSSAGWLDLDLVTHQLSPLMTAPADLRDERWRTDHMLFRRIHAIAGVRGRPASDSVTEEDERPRQAASIPHMWIAVMEVTRQQWLRLGGDAGWIDADPVDTIAVGGMPATCIVPNEAVRLLAQAAPAGWRLELPTDAEWEYACLAGAGSKFSWGDSGTMQAGADPDAFAWTIDAQVGPPYGPQRCGELSPNAFGLYDMHGNAWELAWGDLGLEARGGAWDQPVVQTRASNHMSVPADSPTYAVGLRPVLRR